MCHCCGGGWGVRKPQIVSEGFAPGNRPAMLHVQRNNQPPLNIPPAAFCPATTGRAVLMYCTRILARFMQHYYDFVAAWAYESYLRRLRFSLSSCLINYILSFHSHTDKLSPRYSVSFDGHFSPSLFLTTVSIALMLVAAFECLLEFYLFIYFSCRLLGSLVAAATSSQRYRHRIHVRAGLDMVKQTRRKV
jgi:hypothetical protein